MGSTVALVLDEAVIFDKELIVHNFDGISLPETVLNRFTDSGK